jgi:hypothetical protein
VTPPSKCVDWYVVDPNERRQEAGSPVIFATVGSDDDDDSDVSETGSRALASIRRSSIAIRMASTRDRSFHASDPGIVPSQSNARQREDSTITVRRPSYNDTEGGPSVTVTSSNRDQQPSLPPANWTMFGNNAGISPTDNSGERVYQGMDLDYIMSDLEALDTRRSSLSFVAPQSLPLPPSKDKRKLKDKEKRKKDKERGKGEDLDVAAMQGLFDPPSHSPNLLDVAPWAEADDATGLRRPSTVTLDDSFAGGLRFHDPDYALRRKEWSFIRDRDRVSLPPREFDANQRHWDVWRCSQIGQIRIERATLPPCTCISVLFLGTLLTLLCFMSHPNYSRSQQAESAASQCGARRLPRLCELVGWSNDRRTPALQGPRILHLSSLQPETPPLGQNPQQHCDGERTNFKVPRNPYPCYANARRYPPRHETRSGAVHDHEEYREARLSRVIARRGG